MDTSILLIIMLNMVCKYTLVYIKPLEPISNTILQLNWVLLTKNIEMSGNHELKADFAKRWMKTGAEDELLPQIRCPRSNQFWNTEI